jgi:hypothetical protein
MVAMVSQRPRSKRFKLSGTKNVRETDSPDREAKFLGSEESGLGQCSGMTPERSVNPERDSSL